MGHAPRPWQLVLLVAAALACACSLGLGPAPSAAAAPIMASPGTVQAQLDVYDSADDGGESSGGRPTAQQTTATATDDSSGVASSAEVMASSEYSDVTWPWSGWVEQYDPGAETASSLDGWGPVVSEPTEPGAATTPATAVTVTAAGGGGPAAPQQVPGTRTNHLASGTRTPGAANSEAVKTIKTASVTKDSIWPRPVAGLSGDIQINVTVVQNVAPVASVTLVVRTNFGSKVNRSCTLIGKSSSGAEVGGGRHLLLLLLKGGWLTCCSGGVI